MLKKLCKCGRVIPITEKQCDVCRNKYQKAYDKYTRQNHHVYTDRRWKVVKEVCKSRAQGIDLYHYHKTGKIIQGTLAHHIVEVSEDITKAYDIDNLFWLSDKSHKEIHALYEKSRESKRRMQGVLLNLNKSRTGEG